MTRIGRNDPCPCGSGRKYKHCHGSAANSDAVDDGPSSAVPRAIRFLGDRHRKAFAEAIDQLMDDTWPDEADDTMTEDVLGSVQANLVEWLLAAGDIAVKGRLVPVQELLLGPAGPAFTPAQRAWIEQLGRQPLRLFTATDVRAGEGLTLVDALDEAAAPIVVQERSGSRSARPGMLLGARIMDAGGHLELSGAIYPFSALHAPRVVAAARADAEDWEHEEDRVLSLGLTIITEWLAQHLLPPPIPEMVDASTGEKLVFVTDHYEVTDRPSLERALGAQPDVQGSAEHGWSRLVTGEDGMQRPIVSVNPGKTPARIEVFYRTDGAAERGRPWFEDLAGASVRHLTREISDPKGLLGKMPVAQMAGRAPAGAAAPGASDLPPEVVAQAIEQAIRRSFARWADEPIPALGGNTPRQAIATPTGLERVKGLLRSYEDGESGAAAAQGRRPISYDFLWQQLGIER